MTSPIPLHALADYEARNAANRAVLDSLKTIGSEQAAKASAVYHARIEALDALIARLRVGGLDA